MNNLMKIRFDFIFSKVNSEKVENLEKVNKFLNDLVAKGSLEINSKDGQRRIIYSIEKETSFNLNPNQPTKFKIYPNLLIHLSKEKIISFDCSSKPKIKGMISKIEELRSSPEEKVLTDFITKDLSNFKIKFRTFFSDLKDEGFYLKNIKFNNNLLYFIFGFKKNGNFEHLLNSEFYINSPLDFLSIKELKLTYLFIHDKRNREAEIKIEKINNDINENLKSIKYNISILRESKIPIEVKKAIYQSLAKLGLKDETAYNLPIEYYFNKIFSGNDNKAFIKKLELIDSKNTLLRELKEKKVIDTEFNYDENKFLSFLIKTIRSTKETKSSMINSEKMEILDIKKINGSLLMTIKISNDNINFNEIHQIYLTSNKVSDLEKVLYITLENLDYAFILNKILKGDKKEALDFIFRRIKNYMIYEYCEILEKNSNFAHKYLEDYSNNFLEMEKETKPHVLGGRVEKKLNILLKCLFRNYCPLGGRDKPDGILMQEEDKIYLIDSKQHKFVSQQEMDKIARYLLSYTRAESINSKKAVVIICKGKLSGSLNKESRDRWKESKEYREGGFNISFVSLEFVLELFNLYKNPKVHFNNSLRKSFLEAISNLAEFSKDYSTIKELDTKEKEIIEGLKKTINELVYLPQTREYQV